jgi:hypothetical protein
MVLYVKNCVLVWRTWHGTQWGLFFMSNTTSWISKVIW